MSSWGWRPERTMGIWRYGAGWLRPFVAAAPFVTVGLLILLFHLIGGKLTLAKGTLFDLPSGTVEDGEVPDLVALVMPLRHDTVVFFDESRYLLGDAVSTRALAEHLAEHAARNEKKSILVLADRRVSGGELMAFMSLARQNGMKRVLLAEKHGGASE